jgi:heterodisulfide reductase subunit C
MQLDACTHCGTCSLRCSVAPIYSRVANDTILPSEKLAALKLLASGNGLNAGQLRALQEGSHICTSCYRCTQVCPAGINLQDLWFSLLDDLAAKGYPAPKAWARAAGAAAAPGMFREAKAQTTPISPGGDMVRRHMGATFAAENFSNCFRCETCSNVCPVVAEYSDPAAELDLTPHQIMHALGLGLKDEATSSRMIWSCLSCYQCQEHCPQGVKVAEVLAELKAVAFKKLKEENIL